MTDLESSIQFLPGVGPKRAELIARELGVGTLGELIRIYPFRYVDRSRITPIAAIDSCAAAIQIRARVVRATLYGQGSAVIARNEFSPDGTLAPEALFWPLRSEEGVHDPDRGVWQGMRYAAPLSGTDSPLLCAVSADARERDAALDLLDALTAD